MGSHVSPHDAGRRESIKTCFTDIFFFYMIFVFHFCILFSPPGLEWPLVQSLIETDNFVPIPLLKQMLPTEQCSAVETTIIKIEQYQVYNNNDIDYLWKGRRGTGARIF